MGLVSTQHTAAGRAFFSLLPTQWAQQRGRTGSLPPKPGSAGARCNARAWSAVPPSVVLCVRTTANSKGGGGRVLCASSGNARARFLVWISQLTRTEANLDLEWLERFEGRVASARASLRRSPLTACRLPLAAHRSPARHSHLRAESLSPPASCPNCTTLRRSCQGGRTRH